MTSPKSSGDLKSSSEPVIVELSVGCGYCLSMIAKDGTKLKVCSRCQSIRYCSREHQVLAWKSHKLQCKLLKSVAASSGPPVVKITNLINSAESKNRRGLFEKGFEDAKKACKLALALPDAMNSWLLQIYALQTLGCCENLDEALKALQTALVIAQRTGDRKTIAKIYLDLSHQYLQLEQGENAIFHLAKVDARCFKSPEDISRLYNTQYFCSLAAGDEARAGTIALNYLHVSETNKKQAENLSDALRLKCFHAFHAQKADDIIKFGVRGIKVLDSQPDYQDKENMRDLLVFVCRAFLWKKNFSNFQIYYQKLKILFDSRCVLDKRNDMADLTDVWDRVQQVLETRQ
jgi:tetratricopeptide (TPR) repeat protein